MLTAWYDVTGTCVVN